MHCITRLGHHFCNGFVGMQRHTLESPYAPFLNVDTVCLDAFVLDHEGLKSKYYQNRKELLAKCDLNLLGSKKDISLKVGELSGKCGSFWVDLFSDGIGRNSDSNFSRDKVIQAARSLFLNVPDDLKKGELCVNKYSGKIGRGYLPFGSESGANGVLEIKEGFAFGYNWSRGDNEQPSNPMEEHNKWPPCADDANSMTSFTSEEKSLLENETIDVMNDIGNLLLRAYSLDLYNDESLLPKLWSGGESWNLTRIFRYFCDCSIDNPERKIKSAQTMGSSPHTDWGLLTVIMACDEPGLQLLKSCTSESEDYITVLPQFHENKLFVNCGDFMSLMSSGRYLSPKHRVISPLPSNDRSENVERTSIVHFFYPQYDVKLPPIEELAPELREKYSVFADQREIIQTKSDNLSKEFSLNEDSDKRSKFGDIIAAKWTQVAR